MVYEEYFYEQFVNWQNENEEEIFLLAIMNKWIRMEIEEDGCPYGKLY